MNRQLFKEALTDHLVNGKKKLNRDEQMDILRESIFKVDEIKGEERPIVGHYSLIMVMEECAELIQEVSKHLRGKGDIDGVIEELADVSLCMDYIQEIIGITNEELECARSIKMTEVRKNLEQGTVVN